MNAFCNAFGSPFSINPANVVTDLPATDLAGVEQEITLLPSTNTAHAPHCDFPQPYFTPDICSVSDRRDKSVAPSATSTDTSSSLSEKFIKISSLKLFDALSLLY
jgi:hypothetical protein